MLERMWRKGNSLTLLVGMQAGAATLENSMEVPQNVENRDAWVAQLVKQLPSAQVMIPASWDRVPHQAPCSAGSLLLPLTLPSTLSAYARSLSLSLSLTNK